MNPTLAFLLFAVGIAGLFYLDRDKTARPSKAVWLAVIWLWINGSRSVSTWLGVGVARMGPGQLPPESFLDQAIAATLMITGAIVVYRRRKEAAAVLRGSWPIVLYFSFALVSLSWSDYSAWGLKRWVRALGDVIMVLIVVTDARPAEALRRLISRVGFVLLPASVLLIKYYPYIGRGFGEWGDVESFGVTTNKNELGVLAYVITLGALWQVLRLLRHKDFPNRRRHLLAQGTLFLFGLSVLRTAHSATSGASFALGAGLIVAFGLPFFRARPAAVHALVLTVLLAGGLAFVLGGEGDAARAMGRKADLTGRTEIWKVLIPMAPNPVGGAGFETFWLGDRAARAASAVGGLDAINESHDGYIEVYLNLGLIGVGLIALILAQGYRRAVSAFRHDPALGALLVAYVVTAVTYNIAEAGFRMLDPAWFFLLLAIAAASRIAWDGASRPEREEDGERESSVPDGCDAVELDALWADQRIGSHLLGGGCV
jgi:exopolysaccharide production protein ExoQ